ncbi:MAG: type I-C CRISPR-associated protein Cas5 [Spirochaetes bacterium]|uniref:pre-crRNA processing endonuclease n=1 Tax=Candidatus Ornithospirochaeta stercoripullorum TaxID=2840899 RepID=A0A9D9E2Q7_9SPIO|nr:type I-C CRISPR-associated protein Cas5 [Candidatus Ornithospirochaeta stercoripullorum]
MIFEFWGPRACFTRPELKVERYSYDIPTPSALRAMISAIYWHPSIEWKIDRIHVLNPIRSEIIKRNEINKRTPRINDPAEVYKSVIYIDSDTREPRTSRILIDVHYVIEAHFAMTDKCSPDDTPGKVCAIVSRRLEKGQCFSTPYFGCREFSAFFRQWLDGEEIPAIHEDRDFGLMLYDLDYSNPDCITPLYFHAVMKNGVIDVSSAEVLR